MKLKVCFVSNFITTEIYDLALWSELVCQNFQTTDACRDLNNAEYDNV